ncbi:metallopeptidase family protein [Bifidobacterium sp. ESL0763]|uniref:metallopeptidase family protein n=1 Tax=Bifidobacterium sp. ESL0763 TaxID=2983227 RepID=UPI0023F64840|nr:metallopeptidase family protein [Bifidobacterium sp. ESL0763]MDF7663981.1 metallopeptidase family protein [Bifidobacterium sp. ESL0763]
MLRPPWQARIYRNRHGRGVRTPMFGRRLPRYRTNGGMFDDLVVSQLRRLSQAWPNLVGPVQFAVEDVPPSDPVPWQAHSRVTSQCFPAAHGIPARIVLYRMPMQMHHPDRYHLQWAIRDALAARLGDLYGRRPEEIDPDWTGTEL